MTAFPRTLYLIRMASSDSEDQSWLRRFRSSSFSSELGCEEDKAIARRCSIGCQKPGTDRNRAVSTTVAPKMTTVASRKQPLPANDFLTLLLSGTEMLRLKPEKFPFKSLPKDSKLNVFSWLTPAERGVAARVCQEWSVLMKTPSLWSDIDLATFPPHPNEPDVEDDTNLTVYEAYRRRAKKFINYLVSIRPIIKRFRFAFDIGDVKDGWMEGLQALLRSAQCQEMEYAELNWNETPAKPFVPDNMSVTWCTNDYKDLMYRHRHRQRYFVKFFDLFSVVASNVVRLILPFDWTERSIRALNRLPNLEVLSLGKYFIFQQLEQQQLDTLLRSAPLLRKLTMEVWTPSGRGLQLFQMQSETMEYLDVSLCRGFYLEKLELPNLQVFKVSNCPMNGPLVSGEGIDISCMHELLSNGTPNLKQLNETQLSETWKESINEELEGILKAVCPCARHVSDSSD